MMGPGDLRRTLQQLGERIGSLEADVRMLKTRDERIDNINTRERIAVIEMRRDLHRLQRRIDDLDKKHGELPRPALQSIEQYGVAEVRPFQGYADMVREYVGRHRRIEFERQHWTQQQMDDIQQGRQDAAINKAMNRLPKGDWRHGHPDWVPSTEVEEVDPTTNTEGA